MDSPQVRNAIQLTGLERSDGALKGRVDSAIRRLIRPARGAGWVLGIFDSDEDLVEFAVSGSQVNRRSALAMLCTIPLPETPGSVTLKVTGDDGKLAPCLRAATTVDDRRSLVFVVLRPHTTDKAWSRVAHGLQAAVRQMADVIAAEATSEIEEQRALLSFRNGHPGFFLLTPEFEVAFEWHPADPNSIELAELVAPAGGHLPALLERAVRRLTRSWDFSQIETCVAATAYPIPGLALRVAPMRGAGILIGVFLEPYAGRHPIDHTATMFRLSPRERQVLYALLDGHSVADIAAILKLAESTVNDHIARLIVKTNAHNRIEMAAILLGWPSVRSGMLSPYAEKRESNNGSSSQIEDTEAKPRTRASWRYKIAARSTPT
jgi:DNA-binding CsgD family transcriptional regulator